MKESRSSIFFGVNLLIILALVITVIIAIPVYYHLFDKGKQELFLEKIADGSQEYNSSNVSVTGKLLLDKAIVEQKSEKGEIKYTKHIIPFVKSDYKESDEVYCFLIRTFRGWENNDAAYKTFENSIYKNTDSVVTINGVAMNFLYESLFEGLSPESANRFEAVQGLKFKDFPLIIELDYTTSPIAGIVISTIIIVLLIVLYRSYRKIIKEPNENDINHI